MVRTRSAWMLGGGLLVAVGFAGCRTTGPDYIPTEPERVEMLSLMLPHRLQIQPFTKIKSFNEDKIPDGVLAVVRPIDRFGDPVKAVGAFHFELWTHRKASGDPKGERLAFWERTIRTEDDVRLYWNRAQMYEFQLAWSQGVGSLDPRGKYILVATYRTPWNETIRDEYALDIELRPETIIDAGAAPAASP